MSKSIHLVVIGNGMSGMATIEHLLKRQNGMEITVFGAEPYVNYNRVMLSSVLSGEAGLNEIILNPPEWYESHGIELHTGTSVIKIDEANRKVSVTEVKIITMTSFLLQPAVVLSYRQLKG